MSNHKKQGNHDITRENEHPSKTDTRPDAFVENVLL